MAWFEVENTGELATFSTLTYAPAGFEKELPYTIAVLDYGDFRVFGRTVPAIPAEELRPDRFTFKKNKDKKKRTKKEE